MSVIENGRFYYTVLSLHRERGTSVSSESLDEKQERRFTAVLILLRSLNLEFAAVTYTSSGFEL
jgi:hypothetical protein